MTLPFIGVSILMGTAALCGQALAQQSGSPRQGYVRHMPAPTQAPPPLLAVVSLGSQRLHVYDRTGLVTSSAVSSGRRGHESPEGVFSIIEKKEEHFSNLYDDATMPYMQRITWSGVAFHAGALPGYPASHGCIRLPHGFAQNFFDMTRLNTRVVITAQDSAPVAISHPALFQPKAVQVPGAAASPPQDSPGATRPPVFRNEDGGVEGPMMIGLRVPKPEASGGATIPPVQKAVTTPFEAAAARRHAAVRKAAVAQKAADDAKALLRTKQIELQKGDRALKIAEANQKRGEAQLAWHTRAVAATKGDDLKAKAEAARGKVVEQVALLTKAAVDAKAAVALRSEELKAAEAAIKETERARAAAAAEVKDAARLTEPVSVFVSRTTQRIYVRQAREPVMELPVEIKDASRPIGTHVFTAMDSRDNGLTLAWNVVNVTSADPLAVPAPVEKQQGRKGQNKAAKPVKVIATREEAVAALDRIEFPKEVMDRISPYLHVGSSLIVSDLGPSFETGKATDFIVQTRGEEEAYASVQRIIAEKRIEKNAQRRERRERGGIYGERRDFGYDRRERREYGSNFWWGGSRRARSYD
jgi:hypothetical protein